jgi:hypothetical protein
MANTLKFGNGEWYGKKDTILAYNDENSNYKPLPFEFSRASSATVVNKAGLIETVGSGEPRIDFKDNTKGALLLEPTSTNLVTYSEDFNTWSRSGWTLTSGLLAPNGGLDAYSVLRTAGITFAQSVTLLSNTTYTFSAYIKNVNATNIQLRVQNQAGNTSGTESNCIVFSVTDQTNDSDFTRITHTFNTGDAGTYGLFLGYFSAGEYIVYAAQVEQGSYATSYIPTSGSAVTRIADACNNGGNDQVINSTEGVLYFEGQSFGGTSNGFITLSDGSSTNRISLRIGYYISTLIYIQMTSSGTPQFEQPYNTSGTSFNFNDFNKYALKYKQDDCALFLNGVKVTSISSATMPTNLSKLQFTNSDGVGYSFLGTQKDTRLYNTALTDQD